MRPRLQSGFRRDQQIYRGQTAAYTDPIEEAEDAARRPIQPGDRKLAARRCRYRSRPDPDDYDICVTDLEPGDALIFDFRTLHSTGDAEVRSMRRDWFPLL